MNDNEIAKDLLNGEFCKWCDFHRSDLSPGALTCSIADIYTKELIPIWKNGGKDCHKFRLVGHVNKEKINVAGILEARNAKIRQTNS